MVNVTFSVKSDNPNTIANRLARTLGREATDSELIAEVKRVMSDNANSGHNP